MAQHCDRVGSVVVIATSLVVLLGAASSATAQIPAGYYNGVDASNAGTLRSTLHAVIDDHTQYPYTSSGTDTWDILETADENPTNAANIIDVYRNASFAKQGGGNSFYDREHSWPKSYGFPTLTSDNIPYTDCHLLFLSDAGYNAARSNKPFGTCSASCSEYPTDFNASIGGQGGGYPGDSNWTSGSLTSGTWEVWASRRGDVARALLYADVRYEGGFHSGLSVAEPDLILTDNLTLIANSNTGSNILVAYMGRLQTLLAWHQQDPPDAREMSRNDVIYAFQGNRNPFVDHPEWVSCLWSGVCGVDTTPPAIPVGLMANAGNGLVLLDWQDNGEPDLAGYRVYRSVGGPFNEISGGLVGTSGFTDTSVTNGVMYDYRVTAEDFTGNESSPSLVDSATPIGGGGVTTIWINEFHYDNVSNDVGEFVEVAGTAGTDLSGWTLVGYNGNGGSTYSTVPLSGVLPNQQAGFGTLSFPFVGLQNGSPDAIALVNNMATVVEFVSYEGSFVAANGPAVGLMAVDVGVVESNSTTAVGESLQRIGTGSQGSDFSWQAPQAESVGQVNVGQTFVGSLDTTPPAPPTGLMVTSIVGSTVNLDWADNTEGDLSGYDVYRATTSGGPYSQLNVGSVAMSQFTDNGASAGGVFYYVVTASDASANESAASAEVSASPPLCQLDIGFGNHPTGALAVCGGDLATGHDAQLSITGIPPAAQLILIVGLQNNPVVVPELGGGTLVPVPVLLVLSLPNFGTGQLNLTVPGGGGAISIFVQAAMIEPSLAGTTNAVRIDLLP